MVKHELSPRYYYGQMQIQSNDIYAFHLHVLIDICADFVCDRPVL